MSKMATSLLAEEYDPHARRQVGNFPQAFSHLALVRTALNLHEVGSAQRREPEPAARDLDALSPRRRGS